MTQLYYMYLYIYMGFSDSSVGNEYIYIFIYIYTYMCVCIYIYIYTRMLSRFSHVLLFETPWTIAHKASLSMGFSRQEYWSGLYICPSPYIHTHIQVHTHTHTHTHTSIRISQFWPYDKLLISNFMLLIILVTSIFVKMLTFILVYIFPLLS